MSDIRTILCPVDFSEATPFGLAAAEALAHRTGAPLHLLHVLPHLPFPVRVPLGTDDVYSQWEAGAREQLEALVDDVRGRGAAATGEVARGVALQRILALADTHDAGLIVLPTHGRAGLDRLLHGSVAEAVVRSSRVPVLTVPPSLDGMGGFDPSRILMATDFSDCARAAFDMAVDWTAWFGAELVIGHVFTWEQLGDDGPEWLLPTFTREQVERAISDTTQRLDELAAAAARAGVTAATDLSQGSNPAAEIVRLVEEENVDLLIVASHGHGALKRALLGSTTGKLTRMSPCPMLTVPAVDHELAGEAIEAPSPAGC